VLRAAQDGDTVTATNDLAGTSLTGTFMRSAKGEIQIDMGEQGGTAPGSLFAHFGGVIVRGDPKVGESVAGIGTYELRGQSYVWRRAVVGGQRQQDISFCHKVDCIAVAIDGVGMAGTALQIASPACAGFVVACAGIGRGTSIVGRMAIMILVSLFIGVVLVAIVATRNVRRGFQPPVQSRIELFLSIMPAGFISIFLVLPSHEHLIWLATAGSILARIFYSYSFPRQWRNWHEPRLSKKG
jgi:hypothetical protein